jgi:hypothetical protein
MEEMIKLVYHSYQYGSYCEELIGIFYLLGTATYQNDVI